MPQEYDFHPLDKYFGNVDFVVPGYERSSQYMAAIHQAFYQWAANRVSGAVVLEAGCGEGFGADILSHSADYVVAIDVKEELIQHARRRYTGANVDFQVMDCQDMTFESQSFDVVVCNELIEHLPDHKRFMVEVKRVLVEGGTLICATTNAGITFTRRDGSPMNRNHFREFGASEFHSALAEHFVNIRVFSQIMNDDFEKFTFNRAARMIERFLVAAGIKHKIPIRWRNYVREKLTGIELESATSGGFMILEGVKDQALYLIGEAENSNPQVSNPDR